MAKKKEPTAVEVTEVIDKKKSDNSITATLTLGIMGIILLFLPEESNKFIGIIIGAALLLVGSVTILKYFKEEIKSSSLNLVSGILYALLGLIIILNPLSIMKLATTIFGVYLIANGALKVHAGYISRDVDNNRWKSLLIAGTIIVIFGLILIINPFSGLVITKIAGAFLLIVALFDIVNEYVLKK